MQEDASDSPDARDAPALRPVRADARRNADALLEAARDVFAVAGVDAPVREIATRAGVGVGTVYRHFPQRSDLVAAVLRREVDACAAEAPVLAAEHAPGVALERWLQRYTRLVATKRGLAAALHSGAPAFDALPAYFQARLGSALASLLAAAEAADEVRCGIDPTDLLHAVGSLCMSTSSDGGAQSERMVALLTDGLRYRAPAAGHVSTPRDEASGV